MKRQRVTEAEVLSAIRSSGGKDVSDVQFLVLESDGTISAALLSGTARTAQSVDGDYNSGPDIGALPN